MQSVILLSKISSDLGFSDRVGGQLKVRPPLLASTEVLHELCGGEGQNVHVFKKNKHC
jgi:hypothetical protein